MIDFNQRFINLLNHISEKPAESIQVEFYIAALPPPMRSHLMLPVVTYINGAIQNHTTCTCKQISKEDKESSGRTKNCLYIKS